jgi:hypothetical protein
MFNVSSIITLCVIAVDPQEQVPSPLERGETQSLQNSS